MPCGYLIITDEMMHALCLAAKRGVDVRIITPGIPDKRLVYGVTRSFYNRLVRNGVRIYEWTPGFCHAKMSVSDDLAATCGTINLDYRKTAATWSGATRYTESSRILTRCFRSAGMSPKNTGAGGAMSCAYGSCSFVCSRS